MKLALICVSYRSDNYAVRYLRSIANALNIVSSDIVLDVVLVNSDVKSLSDELSCMCNESENIYLLNVRENTGYFGGVRLGINKLPLSIQEYDFVAVSNVDIELDVNFLKDLISLTLAPDVGVIAPSIFSEYRKNDLNPKLANRVPYMRMLLFKYIYSFNVIFALQKRISDVFYLLGIRRSFLDLPLEGEIYAPHGAFILFTKSYFLSGAGLEYPVFLFGEEIFVAESCRQVGLRVLYYPMLKIYDSDHASTNKAPSNFIRMHYKKAIEYLIEVYYKSIV